jgi:hypothetical protein
MNIKVPVLVALVLTLATLAPMVAGQVFTVKGHMLHEDTAHFLAGKKHTDKHLDKFGDGWIRISSENIIGIFRNDRLVSMQIWLEPRSYEASKLAMTQKMGVPATEKTFPMYNGYGAKWSNYGARWDGDTTCATLVVDNSPTYQNNQSPVLVVQTKSKCDADKAKASRSPLD